MKWVSFFLSGEYFWEVVMGVHRPRYLVLTPVQSNIHKVNVREFLPWYICQENGQPLTL